MKNIVCIITAVLLPLLSYAQDPAFMELYEKYSGRDGFTTVDMSGEMFRAMNLSAFVQDGTTDINRIIIIVAEEGDDSFRQDVETILSEAEFKRISTVRSVGQTVEFYAGNGPGPYSEFLMNTYGSGEQVVMLIIGNGLDIDAISNMTGDSDGL